MLIQKQHVKSTHNCNEFIETLCVRGGLVAPFNDSKNKNQSRKHASFSTGFAAIHIWYGNQITAGSKAVEYSLKLQMSMKEHATNINTQE